MYGLCCRDWRLKRTDSFYGKWSSKKLFQRFDHLTNAKMQTQGKQVRHTYRWTVQGTSLSVVNLIEITARIKHLLIATYYHLNKYTQSIIATSRSKKSVRWHFESDILISFYDILLTKCFKLFEKEDFCISRAENYFPSMLLLTNVPISKQRKPILHVSHVIKLTHLWEDKL